jgi:uncharacterized protein (DUF58 family)
MTGSGLVGVALILVGSVVASPLVVVLGVAAVLFDLVRLAWAGRALRNVRYARSLGRPVLVAGDEVPLTIEVWNAKRLPLPWLRADDRASRNASILERELVPLEDFGLALRNAWTLAPRERVARHFTLRAERRGVVELGPVRLSAGDLLARPADSAIVENVERWLVRPPVVPVSAFDAGHPWGLADRARRGLLEHPASYAGVREYRPGDPLRRLHSRASARVGRPFVKVFDPARERDVLVVLDIQTIEGAAWQTAFEEDLAEELCVVVGSLAARLIADGAAVGLAVAAHAASVRPVAFLAPSEAPGQLGRILDTLARLSPFPSATFERLAGGLAHVLRPGATVVVVTARDPAPLAPSLRRLERHGFRTATLVLQRGAAIEAGAADEPGQHGRLRRAVRTSVRTLRLEGGWRTPERIVIA